MDIEIVAAAVLLALDRSYERTMSALQPVTEPTRAAKRMGVQRSINARVAAMSPRQMHQHIRHAPRGAHRNR